MGKLKRYLEDQVRRDLKEKMVFVSGPRQVGKTTMARRIVREKTAYLNWDFPEDRERILKREWPSARVWVFDEIHKYRSWRNRLKGLYDKFGRGQKILVTGSARLDYYRFGGDSLQGRYHHLRMHPLSLAELGIRKNHELLELLKLGGFPEPFLKGSETWAKRWSREYRTRLIREDITDLERVYDLGNIELMMIRLPELVGSPLSINNLREDLQISHKTAGKWLKIFERLHAIFRIPPFGAPKIRAVRKEQKHYHLDWSLVPESGARFENMTACHLLKWVHYQQDVYGEDIELRFFRDLDGREADFVVTCARLPVQIIECKWSDAAPDTGIRYLKRKFPEAEAYQISATGVKDYLSNDGINVCPAIKFLGKLGL